MSRESSIRQILRVLHEHDYQDIERAAYQQLIMHGADVAMQWITNLAQRHGDEWLQSLGARNQINEILHGPETREDWTDRQLSEGRPLDEIESVLSDNEEQQEDPHWPAIIERHDEPEDDPESSDDEGSFHNLPSPDQDEMPGPYLRGSDSIANEGGNQGGAVEGGEPQAKKPRYIWTHFPNEETAKLRWIQSKFIGRTTGTGAFPPQNQVPFAATNTQTATSLQAGQGGAWSSRTPGLFINTTSVPYTDNPGHDFKEPWWIQLKMTTPYGIVKRFGTEMITANSEPMWLEYFDSKYTYYHCLETHWKMTFNFGSVANASGNFILNPNTIEQGFYIFWKYTSKDDPNTSYSVNERTVRGVKPALGGGVVNGNEQIETTKTDLTLESPIFYTADDYLRQGNWHHKHIRLNATDGRKNTVTLEGTYKYGQCKMDIKTLETPTDGSSNGPSAEGWNEVGSQTHFPENLNVIIVSDNAMVNGGDKIVVGTRMETEQIIQFKDLRKVYKFPDPGMAKFNTSGEFLNTDAAFFVRGAVHG